MQMHDAKFGASSWWSITVLGSLLVFDCSLISWFFYCKCVKHICVDWTSVMRLGIAYLWLAFSSWSICDDIAITWLLSAVGMVPLGVHTSIHTRTCMHAWKPMNTHTHSQRAWDQPLFFASAITHRHIKHTHTHTSVTIKHIHAHTSAQPVPLLSLSTGAWPLHAHELPSLQSCAWHGCAAHQMPKPPWIW